MGWWFMSGLVSGVLSVYAYALAEDHARAILRAWRRKRRGSK